MSNQRMIVHIDFETYSEVDVKKVGAWAYSCHPSTEIICMVDANEITEEPVLHTDNKHIASYLETLFCLGEVTFAAWNSFFEMSICANVVKRYLTYVSKNWSESVLNPKIWQDTAALAAELALPRALGDCAAAIGLPQDKQKDKRGRYLIQRLCKPNRGKRVRDESLLKELYEYCQQDVVAEMAVGAKLRRQSKFDRKVWELDQTINIRGVPVDMAAVNDALAMTDQTVEKLNEEVAQISSCCLSNVSQRQKVMDYVTEDLGYPLVKFDKAYLSDVLKDPELPPKAKRLIEIRQQTGKTSTAKYVAFTKCVTSDNRLHGALMYHAASTGRWGGRLVQLQNLPRPAFKDTDSCIDLFGHRDSEVIELFYGNAMEALSSCIRGMICAPEGKRLIVADYSAIEARALAWLAGQKDILQVFFGHGKIYEHTASKIYSKPIDAITADERFLGKVATLALGYQGGAVAFQQMAETYGVDIEETLADEIKTDWRYANTNIVNFWYNCEKAAVQAVQKQGDAFKVRSIAFRVIKDFLFCRLPSGRLLAYYKPMLLPGRFDKLQVTFMGVNSVTKKWERQQTYGGKLVENITQAVARDLMAEAMLRIEWAGYPIVLSVHDELIAEVTTGFGSVDEFKRLMCVLPHWAEGLPVAAEGYESKRYRKG